MVVKRGINNLTNNEKNFINSNDSIYFNIPTNILLHGTLSILCVTDILLYLLNCNYWFFKGSLFGFVFAITIAGIDLINILARICVRKIKIQHAYYGICLLLVSLYFNYTAIKLGLFPFNQLYNLCGVGVWFGVSAICVFSIKDNIVNDRYDKNSESIYWFKNRNDNGDSKYGIVITKYSLIIVAIDIITGIVLMLLYLVIAPNKFPESPTIATKYGYILLIVCSLMLSYVSLFAWKLVIKQIYINRESL